MDFHNLDSGRIFFAVGVIFVVGIVFMFGIQLCYLLPKMVDTYSQVDPDADADTQQQQIMDEWNKVMNEHLDETENGSSTITLLSGAAWALTAIAVFFFAARTARGHARSPEQAVGYGVGIGVGSAMVLGICVMCNTAAFPIRILAEILFVFGGYLGGQYAGQNLKLRTTDFILEEEPASPAAQAHPDMYYTMGVQAALGGRREEARQHFKRALQANPRNIPAWLQLANLAETPEDAWNYVQQARSINPTDPAVMEAVNVIWPQVEARARQSSDSKPIAPSAPIESAAPDEPTNDTPDA